MKVTGNEFSNINHSTVVIGNNNKVTHGGNEDIDWDKFSAEIINILVKLPQTSEEFQVCSKLLMESSSKDQNKVTTFMKKYAPQFTSDVFSNCASTFLSDVVRKLMMGI